MQTRITLLTLTLVLSGSSLLPAQGILERLERRLREIDQVVQPKVIIEPKSAVPAGQPTLADPATRDREGHDHEERGYLGLVADNDPYSSNAGARVTGVQPDSPAGKADIRVGDLITAVNGKVVRNIGDFQTEMVDSPPGSKMKFEVLRRSRLYVVPVTLDKQPEGVELAQLPRQNQVDPRLQVQALPGSAFLGVDTEDLTERERQRRGLSVREGALVTGIQVGSPADVGKLPLGSAIVEFDGKRVKSRADLQKLLDDTNGGKRVMITYAKGAQLYRSAFTLGQVPVRNPQVVGRPPQVLGGVGPDRPVLNVLENILGEVLENEQQPPVIPPTIIREEEHDHDHDHGHEDFRHIDELRLLRKKVQLMEQQIELMQLQMEQMERQLQRRR